MSLSHSLYILNEEVPPIFYPQLSSIYFWVVSRALNISHKLCEVTEKFHSSLNINLREWFENGTTYDFLSYDQLI